MWQAHAITQPGHRCEVTHHHQRAAIAGAPLKGQHRLRGVIVAEPGKTGSLGVKLVQRGMPPVDQVEVAHQALHPLVLGLLQQDPVQAEVMVPLGGLRKLAAHEQKFFAGVAKHQAVTGAQVGKLLPAVARHLGQQGALAVHHLVM